MLLNSFFFWCNFWIVFCSFSTVFVIATCKLQVAYKKLLGEWQARGRKVFSYNTSFTEFRYENETKQLWKYIAVLCESRSTNVKKKSKAVKYLNSPTYAKHFRFQFLHFFSWKTMKLLIIQLHCAIVLFQKIVVKLCEKRNKEIKLVKTWI